jgi:uncharacterized protein YdhG (YjbR/CyaY superfamily)
MTTHFTNIDEYINTFPKDVQAILEKIRQMAHKEAPKATETISYNLPAFALNGKCIVYFSGWKNHISLYPIPKDISAFKDELEPYIAGKGTMKFPLSKDIPYPLIRKIILAHVKHFQSV